LAAAHNRVGLRVVLVGEKATLAEPRIFPSSGIMEAAAQKRHEGEVFLFARGFAAGSRGRAIGSAQRDYDGLNNTMIPVVKEAVRVDDEAAALLPGFIPYLNARADGDPAEIRQREKAWRDAFDRRRTCIPHRAFRPGPKNSPDKFQEFLNDRQQRSRAAAAALHELKRAFANETLVRSSIPRTSVPATSWKSTPCCARRGWTPTAGPSFGPTATNSPANARCTRKLDDNETAAGQKTASLRRSMSVLKGNTKSTAPPAGAALARPFGRAFHEKA